MKDYIKHHEWKIIEEGFDPNYNRISESIFSIGNGRLGQRANFEEAYSGDSLRGSYIAGVYYPDKTRVGWWKNGYPEYFAKVINSVNWIGVNIHVEDEELDLAAAKILSFRRELDMKQGVLKRNFKVGLKSGKQLEIKASRFLSMDNPDIGALQYKIKPINFSGNLKIASYLDGDVFNEDSNYKEKFWKKVDQQIREDSGFLTLETLKTRFVACAAMRFQVKKGKQAITNIENFSKEKYIEGKVSCNAKEGEEVVIEKIVAITSSLNHEKQSIQKDTLLILDNAVKKGYSGLFQRHQKKWDSIWERSDIKIEGDVAAQQGIRFNIFQLNQTYTGDDDRLNIGPKGFTGEKYGGVTYWDTEGFCLPFYLSTSPQEVSKNLLLYRYKHLGKAIENAENLGFKNGAALYPMVTVNGKECHNEWEITFEEIHRNGAIAYAIWNYVNYTGDKEHLAPYGFEVLLAISRFWAQRVNWSDEKQSYVMLGVTGPNEYENNVNNNFHTNYMASWTLKYTMEVIEYMKKEHPYLYSELSRKWEFNELLETNHWKEIVEKMYFPFDDNRNIYLQQDGFLDKEIKPVSEIDNNETPIHQHWSWDRILRSCYIKQADVMQSLFWFEGDFSKSFLKRHFDFYEPITVHESSLSPCVHTILAAKIGYFEKAYQLYLRTARLDLDDYNNDTDDGLHITSMGGTWMAFVIGFGGLRAVNGKLIFNPFLPKKWKSYSFRVDFMGAHLEVIKGRNTFKIENHSDVEIQVEVWGKEQKLAANEVKNFKREKQNVS